MSLMKTLEAFIANTPGLTSREFAKGFAGYSVNPLERTVSRPHDFSVTTLKMDEKQYQVVYSPRDELSEKPAEARFRLDKPYAAVPRIELFSCCGAPRWDHWGNQAKSPDNELVSGWAVPIVKTEEHVK